VGAGAVLFCVSVLALGASTRAVDGHAPTPLVVPGLQTPASACERAHARST
jgi:hypothetical protein